MFEFQNVASPVWPCPFCYILDASLHIWGRRWCNYSPNQLCCWGSYLSLKLYGTDTHSKSCCGPVAPAVAPVAQLWPYGFTGEIPTQKVAVAPWPQLCPHGFTGKVPT